MSSTIQQDVLTQFAMRARRLYSLPAVALRIIELTRQPHIDTQVLKDCIASDPALAAKILRIVNSSLFGLSQPVADLEQAISRLGIKTLRLLVLGFSLPSELLSDAESRVLGRYWRQALIKAVAARELSESIWGLPGDEAFLAGLLQDIGMLALVQDLGDSYVSFLEQIFVAGGDLPSLEGMTLGFEHTQLSAEMLRHWGLPQPIVHAVAVGGDELQVVGLPEHEQHLPRILHLASVVSEFLIQERASLLPELLELAQTYRDISAGEIERVIETLEEIVPELAEVLELPRPDEMDYRGILLEAYRQLSDAADDVTADLCGGPSLEVATRDLDDAVRHIVEADSPASARSDSTDATRATLPSDTAATSPAVTCHATALANRPFGLSNRLSAAIGRCRQARTAVSLLLAEVDEYESILMTRGAEGAAQIVRLLAATIRASVEPEELLLHGHRPRMAIILESYDRQQGVEVAWQLVHAVRSWSQQRGGKAHSVSVGLATLAMPPRNFPTLDLVETAERCLHAVQLSGGDGVKSIDI